MATGRRRKDDEGGRAAARGGGANGNRIKRRSNAASKSVIIIVLLFFVCLVVVASPWPSSLLAEASSAASSCDISPPARLATPSSSSSSFILGFVPSRRRPSTRRRHFVAKKKDFSATTPVVPRQHVHHRGFSRSPSRDATSALNGGATANESSSPSSSLSTTNQAENTLGLLTFDLDDTLFPIAPVVSDANRAMIRSLQSLGYDSATNDNILAATKSIRRQLVDGKEDPITYTELRKRSIRCEIQRILSEELRNVDLSVHDSVVSWVFNAWLTERHASAERNLFPDAISMLENMRTRHPSVIIGAITNGRGNPLDMRETLVEHFDFCVSGEDDDVFPARKPQKGIYEAALKRYHDGDFARSKIARAREQQPQPQGSDDNNSNSRDGGPIWVHVGDDLANDVGASAECGAYAVWFDDGDSSSASPPSASSTATTTASSSSSQENTEQQQQQQEQPAWSTATAEEIEKRRRLNDEAKRYVSETIASLSGLPDAVDSILMRLATAPATEEEEEATNSFSSS